MSAYDPAACLTVPGRLCLGPTQPGLLQAYPHGGTAVGFVSRARLVRREEVVLLRSETTGKTAAAVVGYTDFRLAFALIQYDTTVLDRLYAYTTTSAGGFSGANTLREPSIGATLEPGARSAGVPLLFSPDNPAFPAVLIYAPIFLNGPEKEIDLVLDKPREEGVEVLCVEDASGHVIATDLLGNLSLT